MSFEQLLADIQSLGAEQETLNKALPADDGKDDEKIQAAAADGGDGDGDGDEDGDGDGDDTMGKSLGAVTLANGEQVEAIDGTELVKSLMTRLETGEGQMQKALEGAIGLIKTQGTMIKSLHEQVAKIAGEGRGRRAVVTVTSKNQPVEQTLAKSDNGMTAEQFMLKSNGAFSAGKINGRELTVIDVSLRQGHPVDPALISKVMS